MQDKTFSIVNLAAARPRLMGLPLEQAFLDHGLEKADGWERSEVVLINTCTVTNAADVEARQMIRRVHRENPDAKIVVTGCYAQRAPRGARDDGTGDLCGRQLTQRPSRCRLSSRTTLTVGRLRSERYERCGCRSQYVLQQHF